MSCASCRTYDERILNLYSLYIRFATRNGTRPDVPDLIRDLRRAPTKKARQPAGPFQFHKAGPYPIFDNSAVTLSLASP